MRIRTATVSFLFCFFMGTTLPALGPFSSLVLQSTSKDNALILEIIEDSDLEDAICYGKLLGKRNDRDVGDILLGLQDNHVGGERNRTEILTRIILESVFFDHQGSLLTEALTKNREALTELQAVLQGFSDPGLKAALLRLLPDPPNAASVKVLLGQGRYCLEICEQNNGFFPESYPLEVRAYLEKAFRVSSMQITAQVRQLYLASKDQGVTALAKRYLDEKGK